MRKIEKASTAEDLRRQAREGMESGPAVDASIVCARLRAKYAAMAAKKR